MPDSGNSEVTRTEAFLESEQLARALAESLQELKVNATGYREAAGEISGVTAATKRLAEGINKVGELSAEALDVIVKMGGPQIARRLDALDERMAVLESRIREVAEIGRGLEGRFTSQDAILHEVREAQTEAAAAIYEIQRAQARAAVVRKRAFILLVLVGVITAAGVVIQLLP